MDPLVGIVTPCRNRREKTARFLADISAQEYRCFRIYLVDSNSTDGTPEMVRRSFPHVELLGASDDKFWTGATNLGVRRALADGCDFILTINDDSAVGPEWLRSLVNEALRGSLDIVASRIDYLHQPGQLWALGARNDWRAGKLFQLPDNGSWADESAELASRKITFPVETLCGNGVLFRRRVFETVGLYDEFWTPHYHADSEFVLRARKHGFVPHSTTAAIVRNDVFNDAAVPAAATPDPPTVEPGHFGSFWKRLTHDSHRLFLSIRSDLYWRAVLIYVWRHCPRLLLTTCVRNLVALLWRRHFEDSWRTYRRQKEAAHASAPEMENTRLWRYPLAPSRAPVPRGEFSMEVLERIDSAGTESFLDVAYQGVFGRPADGDTSGFLELASTPEGRDRVVSALLDSAEAQLMGLGRRITPLSRRMLSWRALPAGQAVRAKLEHVSEDVDRLAALGGSNLVEKAYQTLLLRDPEAAIMAVQTSEAERSPERLLAALLLSLEYGLDDRRRASALVRRWSLWASARRRDFEEPVREEPVDRLANAVAK